MREARLEQQRIGELGARVRPRGRVRVHLNSLQRLLLYAASSVWFMVYALSQRIDYQDAWILDGILLPFVALVALFLFLLSTEEDNRVVALLSAWTILVVTLIPSLKYDQPYGASIDATDHFLMVENLMATGEVLGQHTYSSIPAMHAWLASLGLAAGLSPTTAIQLGLPLTGALMPLLVYWLTRAHCVPRGLAKYSVAASCLAVFPYYLPNGTGFSLVPLVFLLGAVLVREHRPAANREQLVYTVVLLTALFQLTFWHSTTPMLLPVLFALVGLTPVLTWASRGFQSPVAFSTGYLRLALLALVLFVGYRMLANDPVFSEMVAEGYELVAPKGPVRVGVPEKLFEVTLRDAVITTYLIHGRAIILNGLTALGALVLWRYRARLEPAVPFYLYMLLIFGLFAGLVPLSAGIGVSYTRFLASSVAFSPFFVGPFLWWLNAVVMRKALRAPALRRFAAAALTFLLIAFSMIDFYSLQLLVPRNRIDAEAESADYLVWLHAVNSIYQQRMMTFAERYADPGARFAIDVTGQKQFMRYFGSDVAERRGLYLPLFRREAINPFDIDLFLLHWPGAAGGFGERVEFRTVARIRELRETPKWGLVYDNGESFILWIRS